MLLDTSGFYCLLNRTDQHHQLARILYGSATERVTTSYVIAELVALATARGLPRAGILEFADALAVSAEINVVWVDKTLHEGALSLLKARLDKTYSLCDAVSFLVMRKFGIHQALTTDGHFEQEGFHRLLI